MFYIQKIMVYIHCIFICVSLHLFVYKCCVCYVSWLGGRSRQLLAWYMIPGELKPYQREAGGFMC